MEQSIVWQSKSRGKQKGVNSPGSVVSHRIKSESQLFLTADLWAWLYKARALAHFDRAGSGPLLVLAAGMGSGRREGFCK